MISSRKPPKICIEENNDIDPPFTTVTMVDQDRTEAIMLKWGKLDMNDLERILNHLNIDVERKVI